MTPIGDADQAWGLNLPPITNPAPGLGTPAIVQNPFKALAPRRRGLRRLGNIDLSKRPVVHNPDGSISTVASMSFGTTEGEVLLPTITPDGQRMTPRQAFDRYLLTNEHLGIFDDTESATEYSQHLHQQQAGAYLPPPPVLRFRRR